ncbi:MAG: amidohydrolase family protein, partial [Burkholderiales bacterium]|nr:amidohydrolase family protein [Burkholderiales bacterium]
KQVPFAEAEAGATGVELLLPLTLKWAAESQLPLSTAIERITVRPAAILGIDAGHLSAGAAADICIFDPKHYWRVEPGALRSQGKNTPYAGIELCGRVSHTLVGGNIVYEKNIIKNK